MLLQNIMVLSMLMFINNVLCFILDKARHRGRNLIGHSGIINVPGQHHVTSQCCAAVNQNGVLYHHATLGPYNTAYIITFLDTLNNILIPSHQRNGPEQSQFVVIWDNASFHRTALVHNWFTDHLQILMLNLSPYSPFLTPIEEFFSAWRYMIAIPTNAYPNTYSRQWRRPWWRRWGGMSELDTPLQTRLPCCLARKNIAYDVAEVLWPDPNRRQGAP